MALYTIPEGFVLGTVITVSTIILIAVLFYGLKLEVDAGFYECKNCHHKHVPSYLRALYTPHMGTTRYLKCPKCKKRTWSKKVMTK